MTNFPLYDNLIKDISKKDLTVAQKEELVSKLNSIDDNGRDLVYALIQFYNIENIKERGDDEYSEELPYEGTRVEVKKQKENLTWSLSDFPLRLRHILYKFVNMHSQTMKELEQRPQL
jgi:hypothetical protein